MKKCLITVAAVLIAVTIFIACQSQPVQYTVSFEPNGGSYVASQMLYSGQKATKPENPTKSGYVFVAWYADAALTSVYDFDTVVTSNITLYAKWVEKGELVTTGTSVPEVVDNKLGNELVVYEVAPQAGEDTSADVPAGVAKDGYSLILNVTALSTTVSEIIEIGNIEAGIELELVATNGTERTVLTDFGGKAITVTTYVAKGYLEGLKVIYNGVGTNPIASSTYDDGTVDIYADDTEMGEQLGYSTESGMLRFSTTHFSEFLLIYTGAEPGPTPTGDEVTFIVHDKSGTKAVADGDYYITFRSNGSAYGFIDDVNFTTTWKITSNGLFINIGGDDFEVVSTMNPEKEGKELIWSFNELCLCDVIYLRGESGLYSDMSFVNEAVAGVTYSVAFDKGVYGPSSLNNPDTQLVVNGENATQPEGGLWDIVDCWRTEDGAKWNFDDPVESDMVLYAKWNLVGGRVFYVDDSASGAYYEFYDEKGNILSVQTVDGLDNAFCYTVNGVASKDKFYVYDTINGRVENKIWGKYGTKIGVSGYGIGEGKANTNSCLLESGWESNSIFTYIRSLRMEENGGCDDWFVGSPDELCELRDSGIKEAEDMFRGYMFTSREGKYPDISATRWIGWNLDDGGFWGMFDGLGLKSKEHSVVALRSF